MQLPSAHVRSLSHKDMNVCLGSGGAPFCEPSNWPNGAAVTLAVHRKPALCALCSPCCCYNLFYLNRLKASGIGGVIAQYKPLCSRYSLITNLSYIHMVKMNIRPKLTPNSLFSSGLKAFQEKMWTCSLQFVSSQMGHESDMKTK